MLVLAKSELRTVIEMWSLNLACGGFAAIMNVYKIIEYYLLFLSLYVEFKLVIAKKVKFAN